MSGPSAPAHIPVLLGEVLETLAPQAGEFYIDGTFGAGGYSKAILTAADCRVLAFDRDATAVAAAEPLCRQFEGRLRLLGEPFGGMEAAVRAAVSAAGSVADGPLVDGVVLDIGVSSMQLDQAERGFSFMTEGPLDMRMGQDGPSAADVVNEASEALLADIFFYLGEERRSRAVARAIAKARQVAPLQTTLDLVRAVERALGRPKGDEKHPATRTFQALRIWVNRELDELAQGLVAAERLLKPGGRLVVVTFHSLEDRIVKRFLARRSGKSGGGSRHGPPAAEEAMPASFRIVNQQPLTSRQEELAANPRARSAKLRAAVRTEAPAWTPDAPEDIGLPVVEEERRGRGRR